MGEEWGRGKGVSGRQEGTEEPSHVAAMWGGKHRLRTPELVLRCSTTCYNREACVHCKATSQVTKV
eukprot:scaffold778_cov122-Isochrysis_galbana.AAC.1